MKGYILIIIIVIIIVLIILIYLFFKKLNKNKLLKFIEQMKINFKKDSLKYLEFSLKDNGYGTIVDDYSDVYFCSDIYKSHINYQIAFFIKQEYINYLDLSIIEYDLNKNPKKRVIYIKSKNQIYYYNYTVLNNIYYRLIFKWKNNYTNNLALFKLNNINELIDFYLIKINMNEELKTLIKNNFYLKEEYFQFGSICNHNFIYNENINNYKLLLNMVLPAFNNINKTITKKIEIINIYDYNTSIDILNNVSIFLLDNKFNHINTSDDNNCIINNINVIDSTPYFTLLIKNDDYKNLNNILESIKFELVD